MRVHLIAIGGSAMHNMALALHEKGFIVTGSDDEINEPSKSRLKNAGILPEQIFDRQYVLGMIILPLGWLLAYYLTGFYKNIYRKSA